MMKEKNEPKILQIMPAPAGMHSVWSNESGHVFSDPVVCLALVQDGDFTYVKPLEFDAEMGVYNDAVAIKADDHLGCLMVDGSGPSLDDYRKQAQKRLTGPE